MTYRGGIGRCWVLLVVLGCGSKVRVEDDTAMQETGGASGKGGTSTGGTSTAGASTGGTSTAGASTGGSGALAGSGSGGSSGGAGAPASTACTNAFGTPTLLIPDTPNVIPESLSVTGDDLELFYVLRGPAGDAVVVRTRTDRNADFGDATELDPSLWSWCAAPADPGLDVSDDGLRLYMTCIDTSQIDANGGYPSSAIRVAERATRDAAFTLNPNDFGNANVSISVSRDELTAYWSDYTTTTTPLPVFATRASLTEPFGAPMPVPGVVDSLLNPELADDDVHLFGALQIDGQDFHVYMFSRVQGGSFATPTAHDQVFPSSPTTGSSEWTPTVSGDCNSLYFMRRTELSGTTTYTDEVYVAKR